MSVPDPLLSGLLGVAVPLWVGRAAAMTPQDRYERLLAIRAALPFGGCFGEALVSGHGETAKGQAAREFNLLAEALGLMAYWPGGVRAFGWHWDAAAFGPLGR